MFQDRYNTWQCSASNENKVHSFFSPLFSVFRAFSTYNNPTKLCHCCCRLNILPDFCIFQSVSLLVKDTNIITGRMKAKYNKKKFINGHGGNIIMNLVVTVV